MSEAAPDEPSGTPLDIKQATQELLRYGLLEADRKPNIYRIALTWRTEINHLLEPLDFEVKADETRGLLFLATTRLDEAIDANEDSTHPLVRRKRLNMEQSLLLALLRQYFLAHEQDSGVGSGNARISVEELAAALHMYLPDSGSATRDEKRVQTLLEQLRGHSIVTEIDEHNRVGIRPIITHVANPESLAALVDYYREHGRQNSASDV